jgi:hypothetical protein
VRQVLGLRHADAEQTAEGQAAERHRDQHDHEAGDLRRQVRPQRAQQPRQRGLDQAPEREHPERERNAAGLDREQRWPRYAAVHTGHRYPAPTRRAAAFAAPRAPDEHRRREASEVWARVSPRHG